MKSNVGSSVYQAPEVLGAPDDDDGQACGYTCACDLWSLGIVTYIALSGKPPFWGSPKQQLERMQREVFPLTGEFWDTVSTECKDMIQQLLKADAGSRLTTDGVLNHTWPKVSEEPTRQSMLQVFSNLEQFSRAPEFYSLCVASVARQLDHDIISIRDVFLLLDKNHDGVLDINEVKEGFTIVYGGTEDMVAEAEVERIFSALDLDGTGRISYTEFCAAGLGEESFMQEHVLWAAFKTFDLRNDDRISREELGRVLHNADIKKVWTDSVCEDVAREIMMQYAASDDTIYFKDWLALMRECYVRHQEMSPKRLSRTPSHTKEVSDANKMVTNSPGSLFAQSLLSCCSNGIMRLLTGTSHNTEMIE